MFQTSQALQTQFQDSLSLCIGEEVAAIFAFAHQTELGCQTIRTRCIADAAQHIFYQRRAPRTCHQLALRISGGRRRFDEGDDLVHVGQRDCQTFQDVAALTCLAQFKNGTARHDFATMAQECFDDLFQVEQLGLAVNDGDHIDTEAVLQLGLLVQMVEHDFRHLAATQLDDRTHTGFVRLVAYLGDAFDLLLAHQLTHLDEQIRFVNLVGQLVDDDGLTITLADVFEMGTTAHDHATTPCTVAFLHTRQTIDDAGGREVGRRHQLDQLFDVHLWIAQQREASIHHLGHVVWRDVGRHTHGDTGRTVHQQVREARGEHQRLMFRTVIVRTVVHCFFIEVFQQLMRDLRHTDLGVTHRRRVIAIHRTKVTLTIHQRVAQREILRHTHDGVVHRRVAVRVILTDHITDDTRRFLVGTVPIVG